MKDNKNKLFVGVTLVLILIIAIVTIVVLKKDKVPFELSGNKNVISSLEGGSQKEIDDFIKEDLEKNEYKLKDAKIYINPYANSPLSGIMIFKTEEKTDVTVTIKGKHDDDLVFNHEASDYHYIPIYGLYENHKNIVVVKLGNGEQAEFEIQTGDLEFTLEASVNLNELESNDKGLYFITTPINMRSFAIDKYGEIRWLADGMYYHDIVPLENGHFFIGTSSMNNFGLSTQLLEMDYVGRIYESYDIDSGYLNDFFIKDDGNIIVASKKDNRVTISDYIIEIDSETGKVVKSWDLYETLSKVDSQFMESRDRSDYFYNSGIEYYPESDSLLLTYWGGEFVVNLSYNDGSIKWIFADPQNFTSNFDSLLLKGSEGFVYPKSMHSAKLDGDILRVFDNGYSTNENVFDISKLIGSYSSANTYRISGKSIILENSFDEDKQLFSYALGDYDLVDGKDLILFGRELKNIDYNSGISIHDYNTVSSRLIEKKDGQTVLDIELGWGSYSVTKIDIEKGINFTFDDTVSHTTLESSPTEELTADMINMIKTSTKSVPYEFGYSNGLIEHNVLFMSTDEVKLVLIDEDDKGNVYSLKVKGRTESEKIVVDLMTGKYYIYILENGTMYKTDSFIEIK